VTLDLGRRTHDSLLGDHRLRPRGFAPQLTDSEVITMEGVGEFLGLDTDVGIWKYFGRHGGDQAAPSSATADRGGGGDRPDSLGGWLPDADVCGRRVEIVIGQISEQFHFAKIRARDVWRLTRRLTRKILAHTLGIFMNRQLDRSDLQFEGLIA